MEKSKIQNKKNKEEWIQKDLKSKIPKLDKKAIYIPDQNKLNF